MEAVEATEVVEAAKVAVVRKTVTEAIWAMEAGLLKESKAGFKRPGWQG